MSLLTLQYKKVSQSIIIVVHQCHFDFSVEVTLHDRGVDKIEKRKLLTSLRLDVGVRLIGMVLVAEHSL